MRIIGFEVSVSIICTFKSMQNFILLPGSGPRKGNPDTSTLKKIRAPLIIPAHYARKLGGWGGDNRFISG